jgi:hypothetical protein
MLLGLAVTLISPLSVLSSSSEQEGRPTLEAGWAEITGSPWGSSAAAAVYTGAAVLIVDLVSGRTASYDPTLEQWEQHPTAPVEFDGVSPYLWTGSELLVFDRYRPARSFAYDPEAREWRRLAKSPLKQQWLAATDGESIVVGHRNGQTASYDVVADEWTELGDLAPNATTLANLYSTTGAVVAETRPEEGGLLTARRLDPETTEWSEPVEAPGPINGQGVATGSTIAYAGLRSEFEPDSTNATFDPASMEWATVDWGDCPVWGSTAIWADSLIVGTYGASALDPSDGQCYAFPDPDLVESYFGESGRSWFFPVWTGDEVVFWSGPYQDLGPQVPEGLVLSGLNNND